MIYKNKFDDLDQDYITLKSRFMIDGDDQNYISGIEKLAELGQINAIQDFLMLKRTDYVNHNVNLNALYIDPTIQQGTFERDFALGLFFKTVDFSTLTQQEITLAKWWVVNRGLPFNLKNGKIKTKIAKEFYASAIENGKKEMLNYLWTNKRMSGLISERVSEICCLTGNFGADYERANGFAKEDLLKAKLESPDDEIVEFLFLNNRTRNDAKSTGWKSSLKKLANRQLNFEKEREAE